MSTCTEVGAKLGAQKTGITVEEYKRRRARGEKFCSNCRKWEHVSAFGAHRGARDGLQDSCRRSRAEREQARRSDQRERLAQGETAVLPGRRSVCPRDGDAIQARYRVGYRIRAGILPHPSTLPCVRCGHVCDHERRHRYFHPDGSYGSGNQEEVVVLCTRCVRRAVLERRPGRKREAERRAGQEELFDAGASAQPAGA